MLTIASRGVLAPVGVELRGGETCRHSGHSFRGQPNDVDESVLSSKSGTGSPGIRQRGQGHLAVIAICIHHLLVEYIAGACDRKAEKLGNAFAWDRAWDLTPFGPNTSPILLPSCSLACPAPSNNGPNQTNPGVVWDATGQSIGGSALAWRTHHHSLTLPGFPVRCAHADWQSQGRGAVSVHCTARRVEEQHTCGPKIEELRLKRHLVHHLQRPITA